MKTFIAVLASMLLLTGCGSAKRIGIAPADLVFKKWVYVNAYQEEVGKVIAEQMNAIGGAQNISIGTNGQLIAARIGDAEAQMRVRYLKDGMLWDVAPGTEVTVLSYLDHTGRKTEPKIEADRYYAQDGSLLIVRIKGAFGEGYTALSRVDQLK